MLKLCRLARRVCLVILLFTCLFDQAMSQGITPGWHEIPGDGTTSVTDTTAIYRGKLYLFGIGINDHGHYMNVFDGSSWGGWHAVPGGGTTLVSDAAVTYRDKLYLFGIGINDHGHYMNVFDGSSWSGWHAVPGNGTTLVSDAAVTYRDKLYLIGIGENLKHYFNVVKEVNVGPRYNEVAFKATHNSYWVKRDNVIEVGASGTEERILDQLLFEGVRSLELDIHSHSVPHMFNVYHTDKPSNSLCGPLDECLKQLLLFQHALPNHDPVTIVIELKEMIGSPFDGNHTIQDLDTTLEKYLGRYIYRPRDLLARCESTGTIRDCLKQAGWPTLDEMRGKFVFAVIGNWNGGIDGCNVIVSHNRRAWVEYGTEGPGARARTAFLMESPWMNADTPCQEGIGVRILESAIKNSAFVQFEGGADGLLFPDQQRARVENRIVRADVGTDNKPTLNDQLAVIRAGLQLIQNDHPWHAADDQTPLRPAIPLYPERLPAADSVNEPGHRILFTKRGEGGGASLPAVLAGHPSSRWETTVSNTRPATNGDFPNSKWVRGKGCIYARTHDSLYGMRICRTTAEGHWNVSKPLGEDLILTVDITQAGNTITSTSYSNARDVGGAGEMLRLDIAQSDAGACVTPLNAAYATSDGPAWRTVIAPVCFPTTLDDQGLYADTGDVLFVNTRLTTSTGTTAPTSAPDFFEPANVAFSDWYVLQDLSWPLANSRTPIP